MSACPQCGTVAKPTDKFCNTCGTRLPEAAAQYAPPPQAAQPGFGAPAPQPGMQGGPARCQMGHDIAPGASYCAQGHPIALAGMQFAQDQYAQAPQPGIGQPGYGQPPQAPGAFGPPPGGQPGFGPQQPPQAPQYAPQGFGGAPQAPQQPPFGGQGGFGGYAPAGAPGQPQPSPSPIGAPPAYGDPNAGFGGGGFGQPPQAPQQPVFNPAAQPPQGMGQPVQAPKAPSQPPAAPGFSAPTTPDAGAKTLRGFLVAYQANANGDFWPLAGGRHVVGRSGSGETVDIPLADPTISSKHAALNVDGASGAIAIEDTGSTNGTFVNEEHIGFNGRRDLKDGDRVRFGGFTTVVKVIGRV